MQISSRCSGTLRNVWSLKGWLAGVLLLSGFALASCGPVDEETDPCASKTCDFGTCDSSSGACTNKEACKVSNDCIPGFECSDEGTCVAQTECEADSDCDTGICRDGGCTNPETCTEDSDCLPRTHCDIEGEAEEGTCEPDPCNDKTCQRGVCKRGTDKCVSKESCTEESELLDCVSGQKCANGSCADEESYCDEISCDRGVCSFAEGGCVDASECSSDDECLAGKFCNDMNTCQTNLCERNNIDCGNQGQCQPNSGQCENASDCESTEDCVDGHLCVQGTCRLATNACGDASGDGGCPGNQTCEYDEENLEASCAEPDTCETSVDCTGDRRCGGETCLDPEMCRDDELESNDSASEATIFADVANRGAVSAAICSGNSDYFEIDTRNYFEVARGGTLVVDLDVPKRERGLGKLEMEIVDSDGNSQGTVDTGSNGQKARARFTKDLMATDHGVYTVEVRPTSSVKQTGVNYDLSVDVMAQETLDACKSGNIDTITPNQRVGGTTENSASSGYGSSCTSDRNPSNEKIYRLSLDRPQELTFSIDPKLSDVDLTMSLRERCSQSGSEVACVDDTGGGEGEKFKELLGPGDYYLVIQSPEGESGGPFQLNISNVFTVCAESQNYCDSNDNAFECTRTGGQFSKVECENSCNPTTGTCNPPAGNRCGTAETIDPNNAQTRTLVLNQTTNEYEMPEDSCLGSGNTKTGGPEQAFELSVPARKYVKLEATFANEVDGSMYIVEDCADLEGTCIKGAKDSTQDAEREMLEYSNTSMNNDETFFVVVDTDEGQEVTTADLDITYQDLVCTPGETQCTGGDTVGSCSEYGLQVESVGQCLQSCNNGLCGEVLQNGTSSNTCSDARNVTRLVRQASGAQSFFGTWGDFSNDYEVDDTCGGSYSLDDFDVDGGEAVYRLDLQAGELFTATIPGGGEHVMYLRPDGECTSGSQSCLDGANPSEGEGDSIEYTASQQETVYLVVDSNEDVGGNFEVQMELKQPCSPTGTGLSCSGTVQTYCKSSGVETTHDCGYACSGGSCEGDTCSGAPDITSDASQSGGTSFSGEWEAFANDLNSATCSGFSFDVDGTDHVYQLDLQDGEAVQAEIRGEGDFFLYLKNASDCGDAAASCKASDTAEGDPVSISYTNTTGSAETLNLVADREAISGGSFTLDVNIVSTCSPTDSATSCSGTELGYCTSDGIPTSYECGYGCSSGACEGDSCSTAPNITSDVTSGDGATFSGDWNAFTNSYEDDDTCDGDVGISSADTNGADQFYEIDLNSGELLEAEASGDGDYSLYVKEPSNCGVGATACLEGVEEEGDPASLTYTASQDETVILGLDREAESGGTFRLDVQVGTPQCTQSSFTPSCNGSGGRTYCKSSGLTASRQCISGCNNGTCDGEDCSNTISVTKSGTPVTYNPEILAYEDDYDVGPVGGCGQLESSDDSPGPDAAFEISASIGDRISASWNHDDGTIYLVEDCSNLSGTCVAAQEFLSSNDGSISHLSLSNQTYYLIVDVDESSFTDYGAGGTLEIDVN